MSLHFEAVKIFLAQRNLEFQEIRGKLYLKFRDNEGESFVQEIALQSSQIMMRTISSRNVMRSRIPESWVLMNKLNRSNRFGSWEIDHKDGEIAFKISILLEGLSLKNLSEYFDAAYRCCITTFQDQVKLLKPLLASSTSNRSSNAESNLVELLRLLNILNEGQEKSTPQQQQERRQSRPSSTSSSLSEDDKKPVEDSNKFISDSNTLKDFIIEEKELQFSQSDKIGSGGFGTVYKGKMHSIFDVAIKILSECSEKAKKEIHQEACAMKSLIQENILQFHGVSSVKGQVALVTELCDGDLASHLSKKDARFTCAEMIEYALQISKGIAFLHARKMIHRDLKPQNILMKGGVLKIADFGLAVKKETENMAFGGTPAYLAPETFDGVFTEQTDVYAFGMILWNLLHPNCNPFPDVKDLLQLKLLVKNGNRPQIAARIPKELRDLIEACWNTKPSVRPAMNAVYKVLETMKKSNNLTLSINVTEFSRSLPLNGQSKSKHYTISLRSETISMDTAGKARKLSMKYKDITKRVILDQARPFKENLFFLKNVFKIFQETEIKLRCNACEIEDHSDLENYDVSDIIEIICVD